MKTIWQSKTFWVAVIQGVLGVLVALETTYPGVGWLMIGKSALDIILRSMSAQEVTLL
jgi:uncharacterized membrane protein